MEDDPNHAGDQREAGKENRHGAALQPEAIELHSRNGCCIDLGNIDYTHNQFNVL